MLIYCGICNIFGCGSALFFNVNIQSFKPLTPLALLSVVHIVAFAAFGNRMTYTINSLETVVEQGDLECDVEQRDLKVTGILFPKIGNPGRQNGEEVAEHAGFHQSGHSTGVATLCCK